MRGQESGSEHEREADGSAAPATPPPSFGQPSPHVLQTDLTGDDQPYNPPARPESTPGAAQPWMVPGDDGAPYDWYAHPEEDLPTPWPGSLPSSAAPLNDPPLPTAPIVPGAPPWQPPPAFTAAAAGMQVWPSSIQDTRWPAATGEPIGPDLEETVARPGEPGDVPVWPPTLASSDDPGENTVNVRTSEPAVPAHQGQAGPPPPPEEASHAPGQAPFTEPAVQSITSVPVTQTPTSQPELISQVPVPPLEPVAPASMPPQALVHPAEPGSQAPVHPAEPGSPVSAPGRPALPPTLGDQATPPGGIPMLPPLFPPVPVSSPPKQPAPTSGALMPRGAFTPPFAFTPEPAPSPPAPPARSRGNTVLAVAVVSVVVVGIGAGSFFAYQSFNARNPANVANPIPSSENPGLTEDSEIPAEPEPINTTMLNSERTDPGKMTVADAFSKKVTLDGTTFTRVKTNVTKECHKAAAGKFASMLRSQDCRQVLRATYVDSKRKYAVTTGIAVLPTRESAVEADQVKNLSSNLWFRGLPGSAGTGAERVHIAGGYAAGMVWGRYIVFSYATFSDGHTPTAKEKNLGKVSGAFRDQTAKVVERRVTS